MTTFLIIMFIVFAFGGFSSASRRRRIRHDDYPDLIPHLHEVPPPPAPTISFTYDEEDEEITEDDAKAGIKALARAIVEAQGAVDGCPQLALAGWHLKQARIWFSKANEKFTDDDDYDGAMDDVEIGVFHACLALELVDEYKSHFLRLTANGAVVQPPAAFVPPAVVAMPVLPPSPDGATTQIRPPAQRDGTVVASEEHGTTDSAHAIAPETVETVATSAPAPQVPLPVAPVTPALVGAADVEVPEYCKVHNDEIKEALPKWRKLGLIIARERAIFDAKIRTQFPDFGEIEKLLTYAAEFHQVADEADDWSEVVFVVEDGLFFAREASHAIDQILDTREIVIEIEEAAWDTGDEPNDDFADAQTAITAMVAAVTAARLALLRTGQKPAVAVYHLGLAADYIDEAYGKYFNKDADESKQDGLKGTFHGRLAAEAAIAYETECNELGQGKYNTIDEEPDSPEPDYLESDDTDQDEGWTAWRNLTLKVAKLQALFDTHCPQLRDSTSFLKSAQAFVESADDADDWSDVPGIAQDGDVFVEVAVEKANKYIAQAK